MAFIRKRSQKGINYYSLVENRRVEGKSQPVQTQLEWLGDYDQACVKLAKSRKIPQGKKQELATKLARLEGRFDLEYPIQAKAYQAIVIDPPWEYELRKEDTTHRNRIDYPSMKQDEILALPLAELGDRSGCVLWLWTTNNHMPDACQCLSSWGFELKTILTWVKVTKAGNPHIGVGHWLRNCSEHCLLATRGNPSSFRHTKTMTNEPSVLYAQRRGHSQKPDEFYEMVERFSPEATRLEMFARQRRDGWDVWGNDVDKFSIEA
jgi:N6-adenosine-specific RNA methylase IME4